jgi:hypothetical protein
MAVARRRWLWLLTPFVFLLALVGYDRVTKVRWVGGTDLEVEFLVTDAASGDPVEDASVSVISDGGFYREQDEKEFTLRTDPNGTACRTCHDSMCFGTSSGFGFTGTWAVHLPRWMVKVSSPGYEPSELGDVDVLEFRQQVRRISPREAKLVVPIPLHKRPE